MAGEGVMSHAIQSLRMNRRKRTNSFSKENRDLEHYAYSQPIVLRKASSDKRNEIEARTIALRHKENIRLVLSLLFLAVLVVSGLIWLI